LTSYISVWLLRRKQQFNAAIWSSMRSATDCCQTNRQIQQDARGSARITRVAQWCLYENCSQMIEKEWWLPNNCKFEYHGDWGATHEATLKHSSEAENSFWIKSHTGEDMGHFITGPINKKVKKAKKVKLAHLI